MTLYYLAPDQVADYQEGRRVRLARERDKALREIRRLQEVVRDYARRDAAAVPAGDLVRVCSQLLVQAETFAAAVRGAQSDAVLVAREPGGCERATMTMHTAEG